MLGTLITLSILKLFDTMIKPIPWYSAEVWGYQYSDIIEKVHDQFCRKFLKLPSNTTTIFVRGECGRGPLYVDCFRKCIRYWIRLTRMNTYRYPYQLTKLLGNLS